MRVTNQLILRSSVSHLQGSLQAVERARRDIATGRKLHAMSDDPIAGGEVVRIGSSMRAVEQFRRNIRVGEARATAEENVLDQLTNALGRGVELAVSQASSTATAETRLMAKAEVDQLLSFAVGLGNTRFGDDYLFGGTRAGEAPFRVPASPTDPFSALVDASNASVNPGGANQLEVGDNTFVTPVHNGTQVFLDTNALQALRDLSTALGANDVAGINSAMASLQGSASSVQTLVSEQGTRGNDLQAAKTALDSIENTLDAFRADLRDTEIEKAMVELVGRQTQYQAAMAATSRILGLSLANYL